VLAAALLALVAGNLSAQVTFREFVPLNVGRGLEEIGGNMNSVSISRESKTAVGSALPQPPEWSRSRAPTA
jgi:hypothetical protein